MDAQVVNADEGGHQGAAAGHDHEAVGHLGGVVDWNFVGFWRAPLAGGEGVDGLHLAVHVLAVHAQFQVKLAGQEGELVVNVSFVAGDDPHVMAAGLEFVDNHFHHHGLPAVATVKDALLGRGDFLGVLAGLLHEQLEGGLPPGDSQNCGAVGTAQELPAVRVDAFRGVHRFPSR